LCVHSVDADDESAALHGTINAADTSGTSAAAVSGRGSRCATYKSSTKSSRGASPMKLSMKNVFQMAGGEDDESELHAAVFTNIHGNTTFSLPPLVGEVLTTWSAADIDQWLTDNDLNFLSREFYEIDGSLLYQFLIIRRQSPKSFFELVELHLKLTIVDVLRLCDAIDRLLISITSSSIKDKEAEK